MSQQKAGCEKNHVEIRRLLPKGQGIHFDRLTTADCQVVMNQINSMPRGSLAWMTPAQVLLAAFDINAEALLDGLGIEMLSIEELDLTPRAIKYARAKRGEEPLI